MPGKGTAVELAGEAPGVLMFCPTCCIRTSCVTILLAPWMFDTDTHSALDTTSRKSKKKSNHQANNILKVNECQVCKCEFPDSYDFEKMNSTTSFDYALMTAIIAMLSNNRSYADSEFDRSDAQIVQSSLRRFSFTTYHTEHSILRQAKFLNHTTWALKKCLYPAMTRLLSTEQKYTILQAIEGTANPIAADSFVLEAAQIFQIPPTPQPDIAEIVMQTGAHATDAMQQAADSIVLQASQIFKVPPSPPPEDKKRKRHQKKQKQRQPDITQTLTQTPKPTQTPITTMIQRHSDFSIDTTCVVSKERLLEGRSKT